MGGITVLDIQPKGIEITLTISLESLKHVVKCIDNSEIDLKETDEAYAYFVTEFFPDLQDIIKKIEGE